MQREILDPDNPTPEMFYHCQTYYRKVLNPIIDWTTDEVWEFIKENNLRYCCLYDEGFDRLGCIGCPMGSIEHRKMELERYPKYKENYIRAFQKMIDNNIRGGREQTTLTGKEEMEWWLRDLESTRQEKML